MQMILTVNKLELGITTGCTPCWNRSKVWHQPAASLIGSSPSPFSDIERVFVLSKIVAGVPWHVSCHIGPICMADWFYLQPDWTVHVVIAGLWFTVPVRQHMHYRYYYLAKHYECMEDSLNRKLYFIATVSID